MRNIPYFWINALPFFESKFDRWCTIDKTSLQLKELVSTQKYVSEEEHTPMKTDKTEIETPVVGKSLLKSEFFWTTEQRQEILSAFNIKNVRIKSTNKLKSKEIDNKTKKSESDSIID